MTPFPRIPAMATARIKDGNAWKIRVIFMMMFSQIPPAKPAAVPSSVPTVKTISTTNKAEKIDVLLPFMILQKYAAPQIVCPEGIFQAGLLECMTHIRFKKERDEATSPRRKAATKRNNSKIRETNQTNPLFSLFIHFSTPFRTLGSNELVGSHRLQNLITQKKIKCQSRPHSPGSPDNLCN